MSNQPDPRQPHNYYGSLLMLAQEFGPQVPNVARIYSRLLGGKDHFTADRLAVEELLRLVPDSSLACRQNRWFLQRAVRFLVAEAGIRQVIDIGSGLPAQGNVHEVAHEQAPDTRVAYIDYDPVVVAHANARLGGPGIRAIRGDLRKPAGILEDSVLGEFIDLGQPVAVLLVAVLHFVDDADDPYAATAVLTEAVVPGSYLVVSHGTADHLSADVNQAVRQVYEGASASVTPRSREEVRGFFAGLEILPPGIVGVSNWRTMPGPQASSRVLSYVGVGRKP